MVHRLAESLAGEEAETLGVRLDDVEARAVVETFSRLTFGVTLVDVQVKAVVETLANTPAKMEAKTVSDTLKYVEKEALGNMLPKAVAKTKSNTLGESLEEVEAKARVEKILHQTKHYRDYCISRRAG